MTTRLTEPSWIIRAIARARSLEGEPWTKREQEVIDAYAQHGEDFEGEAIFMTYGIRPEKVSYVKGTVKLLEEAQAEEDRCKKRQKLLTGWVRLQWCCEALIGGVRI
jgi:hypothetical protein